MSSRSSGRPMDDVITVVNELHDALSEVKVDLKLDLPQIAVIGSQSSGKSSVLENIVGKDFLPRGSNIVTRCPLVLQLVQLHGDDNNEEWGEFTHKPNKKFFDFSEIRDEINNRTGELTDNSAGNITNKPINLKVFSPHVLNLTLVDLPGLVMNAVGDQPKDIDKQIKDMVTNYVRPANTIMLAVSPANADMATSAALRLARQIDPEGTRTLGVLTKLDLMDKGVDARDVLDNKLVPLRLGFIGVVNRSQLDIQENKSIELAHEAEAEYFKTHPAYRNIADRQGTEYLTKTLNKVLLQHIQKNLPELKSQIDKLTTSTRKQQDLLGMNDANLGIDNGARLLDSIKVFSDGINQSIEGEAIEGAKELVGGARIDYIFHECFTPYVTGMRASKDLTDNFIRLTMRNRSGMQSTLFPSDQVFITLAKMQVRRLEDPAVKCVSFIYDEMVKIIEACAAKHARFPTLRANLVDTTMELLQSTRQPAVQFVKTEVAAESGYINIKHPYMQEVAARLLGSKVVQPPQAAQSAPAPQHVDANGVPIAGAPKSPNQSQSQPLPPPSNSSDLPLTATSNRTNNMVDVPRNIHLGSNAMTQQESLQNSQIRDMVEAYFSIVQRNVSDQVPKIVTLMMIAKVCEELYPVLIKELYKDSRYDELMAESKEVVHQRKATSAMMVVLKKANAALSKVSDMV